MVKKSPGLGTWARTANTLGLTWGQGERGSWKIWKAQAPPAFLTMHPRLANALQNAVRKLLPTMGSAATCLLLFFFWFCL